MISKKALIEQINKYEGNNNEEFLSSLITRVKRIKDLVKTNEKQLEQAKRTFDEASKIFDKNLEIYQRQCKHEEVLEDICTICGAKK